MGPFSEVLEILERSVGGEEISAHGNFWRGKTRDEFVELDVYGKKLIALGDAEGSSLIKALRATRPFGNDIVPRTPGAIYPRMPARRPPMTESDIQFLIDWINEGCPADHEIAALDANGLTPDDYVRFFREFDDFFMFAVSDETRRHIGEIMGERLASWPGFGGSRAEWEMVLQEPAALAAVKYLSTTQLQILHRFFGDPLSLDALAEAFFSFGRDTLPSDPLRPRDTKHRMNGAQMWHVWLAFADAAATVDQDRNEWEQVGRRVVLGMVADSLFRTDRPPAERLAITRYDGGDADLEAHVLRDFDAVQGIDLRDAIAGIAREAIGISP